MAFVFDDGGISVQTFDEALAEKQESFRQNITTSIATDIKSLAGQVQRIIALDVVQKQEQLQELLRQLDPRSAEGVHLDNRLAATLGVTRLAAQAAEVLGTATGVATTVIPDGHRLSVGGFEFAVIDGPYVIGGGGTIANVRLRSTLLQAIDVSTLGAWTLVDNVLGFDSFDDDDEQPIVGRVVETDTEYRARAEIERFARASGPLAAIDAAVSQVEGVTYAKASHHVDPSAGDPDPINSIPLYAINLVVQGGDSQAIAEALLASAPAGTLLFGTTVSIELGSGADAQTVSFDRVAEVDMWINVALQTSTSEETAPGFAQLEALVQDALEAYAVAAWQIGKDVLPSALAGAVSTAGILGFDDAIVTVSLDNGATDPFSSAKRPISIRQRSVYADARVVVTEV